MTPVDQSRTIHGEDVPYILISDARECKRLDDLHEGIDTYLGHKLSHASIAENVTQILEIGCGSGAWAIQAAQTYPKATVTAIDISPLPPRPIPTNMKFQQVNVNETLPFEPASYDIVHTRFVLMHLPNWEVVLQRVISLLKPGGWLLVEDVDTFFSDDNGGLGPGMQKFLNIFHAYMGRENIDIMVGSKLEATLKAKNQFSEVNAIKIQCPVNGKDGDSDVPDIGRVMGATVRTSFSVLPPKLEAAGITSEMHQEFFQEFNDPARNIYYNMYMTWSRKP